MCSAKVIDLAKKRAEKIEVKKRQFERVLFQELVGVYSEIAAEGYIYPIEIINISPTGLLLQIPISHNPDQKFKVTENVDIRLYFTKKSYLPVRVTLKHRSQVQSKSGQLFVQFGAEFDQASPSYPAISSFVQFVYRFAEFSLIESVDGKVSFF